MGGQGSGRIANPVNRLAELKTPIANAQGDSLFIPNVSSIKRPVTLVSGAVLFADSYGRVNGDTSKIFMNPAGNIGIGTNSPTQKVHIYSSIASGDFVGAYINNIDATGNSVLRLGYNTNLGTDISQQANGATYIDNRYNDNASAIVFRTKTSSSAIEAMRIISDGKVGIGTPLPAYAKVELGTTSTFGSNALLAFTAIDGTYNPRVIVSHVTATNDHYLDFNSSYSNGSGFADWIFRNGKIGIDTVNPAEKLHISGGSLIMSNNNPIKMYDSASISRTLINMDTSDNIYILGRPGASDVYITNSYAIIAKNNGLVGINNVQPDTALSVKGEISMANGTKPTLTPSRTSGAIFVSGGALYFVGSLGTTTKLANA